MTIDSDVYDWNQKGIALSSARNYKEAIECFDKAIELDPNDEWSWYNKGLAFYDLGRFEQAIQCFEKATELVEDFVAAWNDKGAALLALTRYNEAIECYHRAINIDPNDVITRINEGNALFTMARYEEAIKSYDKAIEMDQNIEWASTNIVWAWKNKGNAFDKLGEHDQAVKCYKMAVECSKKAMEWNPTLPSLYVVTSKSLLAINRITEAKKCLEEGLKLDQENVDILAMLSLVYSDYLYDHGKSLDIERLLLTLVPDDYAIKASIAEDLVAIGHYEEGRAYALQIMNQTKNEVYLSIAKFLVFASYVLEGKTKEGSDKLIEFLSYYVTLDANFKIEEDRWIFRGLSDAINKSNVDAQSKHLLLLLLGLLQGNIDRSSISSLVHIS